MANTIKMRKCNFHVWKYGIIVGRIWVSFYNKLELHVRDNEASKLSHAYNFFK